MLQKNHNLKDVDTYQIQKHKIWLIYFVLYNKIHFEFLEFPQMKKKIMQNITPYGKLNMEHEDCAEVIFFENFSFLKFNE